MKFLINFPTLEKQKKLIESDEEIIIENMEICEKVLKDLAFEILTEEELNKIFIENNIKIYVDFNFSPIVKEMEVNTFE